MPTIAAPWLAEDLDRFQRDPEFLAEDLTLAICERLCEIMAADGVKKKDLAARLGKTPSAVSQLLSGDQNMSLRRLVETATALGYLVQPPEFVPLVPEPVHVDDAHGGGAEGPFTVDFEPAHDCTVSAWIEGSTAAPARAVWAAEPARREPADVDSAYDLAA